MSQIFKKDIPKEYLFDFLNKCCVVNNKKYTFSKSSYKKAKLEKLVEPFCKSLKEFYFKSKHYYIERNMTYKNLITILRQICKFNNIPFTSDIKYSKSKYEITYFIFQD